jgi:dGTPase
VTVAAPATAARFKELILTERRGIDRRGGLDGLPSAVMRDKARIIMSPAFRRLQTKAQVFSLERDASVRTRLTHSLEVAMCGELAAEKTFELLLERGLIDEDLRVPFIGTVENACLLHDIGNPPFGHLGEYAIQKWFSQDDGAKIMVNWRRGVPDELQQSHLLGFKAFNGNAQSFRIATRLQWIDGPLGMGLSYALLGSMVKYLTPHGGGKGNLTKKIGYFEAEADVIEEVWKKLGLPVKEGLPQQRHPLTFIMEAADDIAYALSDVEDALEKRLLQEDALLGAIDPYLRPVLARHGSTDIADYTLVPDDQKDVKYPTFLQVRNLLAIAFIDAAAVAFVDNLTSILDGTWTSELLDADSDVKALVKQLKDIAKREIFLSPEAVDVELSGYHIVQRLLDAFEPLLRLDTASFRGLERSANYRRGDCPLERRLYALLGRRQLLAYSHHATKRPELDIVYRTHLVTDYISGMTDSYAVKLFNIVTGVSVGASL